MNCSSNGCDVAPARRGFEARAILGHVNSSSKPIAATTSPSLNESGLAPDPFAQFDQWFQRALAAGLPEPTAMTLATADKDGIPSARIVLLKEFDQRGFTFFTNYGSQKGKELTENPHAALVFYWAQLERQVRIVGTVGRVTREESERYFSSRPFGSKIGAWASNQSGVLQSRDELDRRVEELTRQYDGKDVPLPPNWGGYRLVPATLEFWQSRPNRVHDRFRYSRLSDDGWRIERLSP